jgi:hypothetical protein
MCALDTGIGGPDPPLGAGAPERDRQRGHRAWLPDPGARADPQGDPRAARPCSGAVGDAACSRSQRASMRVDSRLDPPAGFPNGGAIPRPRRSPSPFRSRSFP